MSSPRSSQSFLRTKSTSSDSSPHTDFTEPTDYTAGYHTAPTPVPDSAHALAPFDQTTDGTIDPRKLQNRESYQSSNSYGQWIDNSFGSHRVPRLALHLVDVNAQEESAQGALLSVHDRPSSNIDAPPWTPVQVQQSYGSAFQRSSRSLAQGPARTVAQSQSTNYLPTAQQHPLDHTNGLSVPSGFATTSPNSLATSAISYGSQPTNASFLCRAESGEVRSELPRVAITAAPRSSGPSTDSTTSEDSLICEECRKSIGRSGDLERHKRDIHKVSPLFYRCDQCDYDDYRLDKVMKHCRDKHRQQPRLERYSELHGSPSRVKRPRGPNKVPRKSKS